MPLQLAVRITGDASSLKTSALEATNAVTGMGAAVEAAGAKSAVAAGKFQQAANAGGSAVQAAAGLAAGGGSPGLRPQIVPSALSPGIPPLPPGRPTPQGGLRRDQWQNLGYQGGDIFSSGFSGASPLTVLAQQGPQIVQVLADAPGGIAGGLKAVASGAMSILTPVRLVAGGFVGLGATAVALGVSWSRSQDAIEEGLTGIGRKSRATAEDINAIGASLAANGRLSTGEGRGVATQLAAAGNIDVSNIGAVGALAPGYAKMFGKDIDAAGADLARLFSDPVKGLAEMEARLGSVDGATKDYVRTLMAQGDRQEAIRVMVRAVLPDMEAAAQKTSAWAKAYNELGSAAGAVGAIIAKPFRTGTTKEQLAAAEEELRAAENASRRGLVIGGGPDLAQQRAAAITAGKRAERDRLQSLLEAEEAAPGRVAASERSQTYNAAVGAILPEIEANEKLTSSLKLLTDATGDLDGLFAMSATKRKALATAMEATRGAIDSTISAEERARKSQELTIRGIEARTAAERAAIAEEQKRLDLAGQAMTADQRRLAIEGARAAVMAQSTRDSQDRLRSSTATAAAAGLSPYRRRLAELDDRFAQANKADEGNPDAIANNQRSKALDRQAIDSEAIGGPLREANRNLAEQAAALKLQEASFGASAEAAAKMAAAQQLTNQYTADGVPITESLRRAIDGYAGTVGKVAAEQDALLRRQREIVGGLDDIRGSARSGITGIFSDLSKGKSPLDGITSSLDSMSSRIFDRTVSTPLVNNLIGQEGKAGGGLFGDAVSSIFGKAQAVSTAQISAGVVNLSGTIAGLTGGAVGAANSNVAGAAAGLTGSGGSSAEAAKAITSKLSGSKAEVADYVKQAAIARGIDPNVATRVVNAESGFNVAATNLTSKEQSYGVMQLNTMGGLGAEALKAGVDVRNPDAWRSQVDYGLDVVKKDGWRQWYGARDAGISRWEGIGGAVPAGAKASVTAPTAPAAMPQLQNLDASLQSFSTSTTTAQQSLTGLTGNLTALPGPLSQTSAGLSQVGSSLGSGGGGGLLGALAGLFGGGGASAAAAATPTVTAATGGHIRGPGTSTSDSINARLSDGEFVVNAKATSENLSVLHAINEGKRVLPAFAEGGVYGSAPPAAAYQREERAAGRDGLKGKDGRDGAGASQEVHIHGAGKPKQEKRSRGRDGGQRLDLFFNDVVASQIGTYGSGISKALEQHYGLQRRMISR
ncbi:phage tail length tape measure family protein [Methylobacterium sp. Leaf85]|uniref:phage tail length tape measure family protein n=1 Tax=Methylobacterium sp. Leaf85 TaxID=1736241 RepID=UPI0006FD9755|nr:phage tail length tape measure family protein [Methylobacterium sp. Leaf85]KQO53051.1 hypothetical protein ASF08_19185 [Methylobacterium sp. Leaf85]